MVGLLGVTSDCPGEFGMVYRARLECQSGVEQVAVKTLRGMHYLVEGKGIIISLSTSPPPLPPPHPFYRYIHS